MLGELEIPAPAYYGIHTWRAVQNFPITGTTIRLYPELISALAAIKLAAASANRDLGLIDERTPRGYRRGLHGDHGGRAQSRNSSSTSSRAALAHRPT